MVSLFAYSLDVETITSLLHIMLSIREDKRQEFGYSYIIPLSHFVAGLPTVLTKSTYSSKIIL